MNTTTETLGVTPALENSLGNSPGRRASSEFSVVQPREDATPFVPFEPTTWEETGLSVNEVQAIVLRFLLNFSQATGRRIAELVTRPAVVDFMDAALSTAQVSFGIEQHTVQFEDRRAQGFERFAGGTTHGAIFPPWDGSHKRGAPRGWRGVSAWP